MFWDFRASALREIAVSIFSLLAGSCHAVRKFNYPAGERGHVEKKERGPGCPQLFQPPQAEAPDV